MIRDLLDGGTHVTILIDEEDGVGVLTIRLVGERDTAGVDDENAILGLAAYRSMCMTVDNDIRELGSAGRKELVLAVLDMVLIPMADHDVALPDISLNGDELLHRVGIGDGAVTVALNTDNLVFTESGWKDIIDIALHVSCMNQEIKWLLLTDGISQEFIIPMGVADNYNLGHVESSFLANMASLQLAF